MKKKHLLTGLITVLLLAACGSTVTEEATTSGTLELVESYADALAIPSQLALGSLQLEETDLAIDEEQATELLPLWQAYQSLSNSDKAAGAEIYALVKQIQSSMNAEQIEAIAAMELTAEDVTSYAEEVGLAMGRRMGGGGEDAEGAPEGGFGGGVPGGGVPGGGFGGGQPGGGAFGGDADARATRMAEFSSGDMDMEQMRAQIMNQALIGSLIRNMQVKTGEIDPDETPLGFNRGLRSADWVFSIVSETTGIPLETIQAETAEGSILAEVIADHDGDLAAVETALTEAFEQMPAGDNMDIEQRVSDLLSQSWAPEEESD